MKCASLILVALIGAMVGASSAQSDRTQAPRTERSPYHALMHNRRILVFPFDEAQYYSVPTHPNVTTTVKFPTAIEGIDGKGFTDDPSQMMGTYQLSFVPGNPYFSITPLTNVTVRNLNVYCEDKVIVLEPFTVAEPEQAAVSVQFAPIIADPIPEPVGTFARKRTPPKSPFKPVSAARLVSLLDALKLLVGLDQERLRGTLQTMPHVQLVAHHEIEDYGDFAIELTHAMRNDELDALGFVVRVTNLSTKNALRIDPESFTVRAGDEVYHQIISDARAILPPGRSSLAFFAIARSADGRPNYLSPNNRFHVSVDRLGPSSPLTAVEAAALSALEGELPPDMVTGGVPTESHAPYGPGK